VGIIKGSRISMVGACIGLGWGGIGVGVALREGFVFAMIPTIMNWRDDQRGRDVFLTMLDPKWKGDVEDPLSWSGPSEGMPFLSVAFCIVLLFVHRPIEKLHFASKTNL